MPHKGPTKVVPRDYSVLVSSQGSIRVLQPQTSRLRHIVLVHSVPGGIPTAQYPYLHNKADLNFSNPLLSLIERSLPYAAQRWPCFVPLAPHQGPVIDPRKQRNAAPYSSQALLTRHSHSNILRIFVLNFHAQYCVSHTSTILRLVTTVIRIQRTIPTKDGCSRSPPTTKVASHRSFSHTIQLPQSYSLVGKRMGPGIMTTA